MNGYVPPARYDLSTFENVAMGWRKEYAALDPLALEARAIRAARNLEEERVHYGYGPIVTCDSEEARSGYTTSMTAARAYLKVRANEGNVMAASVLLVLNEEMDAAMAEVRANEQVARAREADRKARVAAFKRTEAACRARDTKRAHDLGLFMAVWNDPYSDDAARFGSLKLGEAWPCRNAQVAA